jgi:type IV pilus assembly protein PilQ
MTEVAACFLVALSPVQAETSESFEQKLLPLSESPWLVDRETAIADEVPTFSESQAWTAPLKTALADSVSPKPDTMVSGELVRELEALSSQSSLNFPEPSQTSVAQMTPSSRPAPPPPASGQQPLFPNPEIIIQQNGNPVQQSGGMNPTILNPRVPVAPVRSRAVPPPVGDLAISNINAAFDMIDLGRGGQAIVPRLVLREAPAREVLAVLTRYAGMNLIFTDGQGAEGTQTPGTPPGGQVTPPSAQSTITLDIENESVQDVFNSVLMASGLKASRRGNTIFAGTSLLPSARNIITRTIRLNQASAEGVANALASQGASVNILFEGQEDVQLAENAPARVIRQPPTLVPLTVQQPDNDSSVLILEGLVVSTDPRLNTVTLVGEPRNVELATSMITQMDARRRQVAVNVKIVDVNLNNVQDYNSSFSFGINDSYFIQDNGTAVMRFGDTAPARVVDINSEVGRAGNPPLILNPFVESNTFVDFNNPNNVLIPEFQNPLLQQAAGIYPERLISNQFYYNRFPINAQNPFIPGITEFSIEEDNSTFTYELPTFFQYPRKFQAQIEANIQSGNAKILTDPTLIVQEGQEAKVKLTDSVIESVVSEVDPDNGVRTTTPVLGEVGLTLNIFVDRIDDNGFITVRVKPRVAQPSGTEVFESGIGSSNELTLINQRELDSGVVRLRDGQTFILSGIISEIQQTITSKVPVLGDIPVIGALFRSSSDETDRSEVIIMLTPKIIPDSTEVQFGYQYTPDQETAEYLRRKGFPVQAQP